MFSHVSVHPSIRLSVHTTQTGYTTVGMPLVFTQEDFLVSNYYRPRPKDGEGNSFSLFVSSHLGGTYLGLVGVPTLAGG